MNESQAPQRIEAYGPIFDRIAAGIVELDPDGMFDATIGSGADGWEDSSTEQRINYILMNDDRSLEVNWARRVFTEKDLGQVSDHVAILADFEIARAQ